MSRRRQIRSALTIAGSDSGGGAGVQADLKTFASLGVHGTSVVTCLTAQNPRGVLGIHGTPPRFVRRQLEAVWEELPPAAAKTGMLFSIAILREVIAFLKGAGRVPLVVDPVMVATSGARLLRRSALTTLCDGLFPLARIITPNLDEASVLLNAEVSSPESMRSAARTLQDRHGCAVLVKGGHLPGPEAVDVFRDGREEYLLSSRRVVGVSTHGTGCTYSAAIAAGLARGLGIFDSVVTAKNYVQGAIQNSRSVNRHTVLCSGE